MGYEVDLRRHKAAVPVRGEVVVGSHSVVSEQSLGAVLPSLCRKNQQTRPSHQGAASISCLNTQMRDHLLKSKNPTMFLSNGCHFQTPLK